MSRANPERDRGVDGSQVGAVVRCHLGCHVHAVVVGQEVDAAKDLRLVEVHDRVRVTGPVAVFAVHLLEILEVVFDREVLGWIRRLLFPVVEKLAT
jgi:hypothetical protein